MAGNLMLHTGGTTATLDEVRAVVTPPATKSHKPVPHIEVVDVIKAELSNRGFPLLKESYGLSHGGARMFGVIDVTDKGMPDGQGLALGFRNAHDKAWSMGYCGGPRVFVCDNLAFTGEVVRFRKHTSRIDPAKVADGLLEVVLHRVHLVAKWLDSFKAIPIKDVEAKALLLDMWRQEVLPTNMVKPAANLYLAAAQPGGLMLPRGVGGDGAALTQDAHELYGPRNLWSLYNCVTETWKPLRNDNILRRSSRLNGVFGNLVPMPVLKAENAELETVIADAEAVAELD
jgi:hypothetical protein